MATIMDRYDIRKCIDLILSKLYMEEFEYNEDGLHEHPQGLDFEEWCEMRNILHPKPNSEPVIWEHKPQ